MGRQQEGALRRDLRTMCEGAKNKSRCEVRPRVGGGMDRMGREASFQDNKRMLSPRFGMLVLVQPPEGLALQKV